MVEIVYSVQFAIVTRIGQDFVDCKISNLMIVLNMVTWEVIDIAEVESPNLGLMITITNIIMLILMSVSNIGQTGGGGAESTSNNQKQIFWVRQTCKVIHVNLVSDSYVWNWHAIIQHHNLYRMCGQIEIGNGPWQRPDCARVTGRKINFRGITKVLTVIAIWKQ